jgi:hypothetical protein
MSTFCQVVKAFICLGWRYFSRFTQGFSLSLIFSTPPTPFPTSQHPPANTRHMENLMLASYNTATAFACPGWPYFLPFTQSFTLFVFFSTTLKHFPTSHYPPATSHLLDNLMSTSYIAAIGDICPGCLYFPCFTQGLSLYVISSTFLTLFTTSTFTPVTTYHIDNLMLTLYNPLTAFVCPGWRYFSWFTQGFILFVIVGLLPLFGYRSKVIAMEKNLLVRDESIYLPEVVQYIAAWLRC